MPTGRAVPSEGFEMKRRSFGIQRKLLLYNALLVVVVTVFFSLIIIRTFAIEQRTIEDQNINATESILAKFNSLYEDMDDVTENLILDSFIQNVLAKDHLSVSERENLEKTIAYSNRDGAPYYYVTSGGRVYTNKTTALTSSDFEGTDIFGKLKQDYAKLHFIWSTDVFSGTEDNQLFVCRNIHGRTRARDAARIFFVISDETMRGLMPEGSDLGQVWLILSDEGAVCCAIDGTGAEISDGEQETIRQMAANHRMEAGRDTIYTVESDKGFLCAGYHAATGFTLVTFVSRGVIARHLGVTFGWIAAILVIGLTAAFLVSAYISRTISKPIKKISDIMGSFGMESLDSTIEIDTNTELDHIGNAYNVMVGKIQELMETITGKEREKRKLELEMLLYQIHPHFLYNTLNNVYMMARQNKQTKIMEMVDSLSRFLQITLSAGREEISIKRELEHACAYMKIQQIRNSNLFTYTVSCEDSLASCVIPKMILQPLVENSIKHGFAEITDGGMITITVSRDEDKMVIDVKDNGGVMDSAVVEQMNRRLALDCEETEPAGAPHEGGYGVVNVARRLKLKYGEKVRMSYMIPEGETVCRIELDIQAVERREVIL